MPSSYHCEDENSLDLLKGGGTSKGTRTATRDQSAGHSLKVGGDSDSPIAWHKWPNYVFVQSVLDLPHSICLLVI